MRPFAFPVIFERDNDLWTLVPGGKPTRILKGARSPAVSPEGRRVAYLHDRAVWMCDIRSPQNARPVCALQNAVRNDDHPVHIPVISWDPRHPALVFSEFSSYILRSASSPSEGGEAITLSSIYRTAIPTSSKAPLAVVEPWLTPISRGLGDKGLLSASHPAWSPDGKFLALARGGELSLARLTVSKMEFGRPYYEWDETPVQGVRIEGGTSGSDVMGINSIAWRPDGRAIVTLIRRWNGSSYSWIEWHPLRTGVPGPPHNILGNAHLPDFPRFTPEGRSLIFNQIVGRSDGVFVHDLTTGRAQQIVGDARNAQCFH